MRRVSQKVGHCGPAVIEMLLSATGVSVSQEEIARLAGVTATIHEHGSRPDQLYEAVTRLELECTLLGKYGCRFEELERLTEGIGIPVGVEWQGRFVRSDGQEFDIGHYSIVVAVDRRSDTIVIVDPDDNSAFVGGRVPLTSFLERWWEINDVPVGEGRVQALKSNGLALVIPRLEEESRVRGMGFQPMTLELLQASSRRPTVNS